MTKNPISVARKVMELSPHVMMCGDGATRFARAAGFPEFQPLTEKSIEKWKTLRAKLYDAMGDPQKFDEYNREAGRNFDLVGLARGVELLKNAGELKELGTVGSLALDSKGTIIAGTSTSGWPLRLPGRVSDSSVIGAGTYATKYGAASCTGMGEYVIKHNLTRQVCDYLEQGYSPTEACEASLKKMLSREKVTVFLGLIALDAKGEVGGATTKSESFVYEYQRLGDEKMTQIKPAAISI
jgi:isoaspartyl peptidase/L-asparaginase-like protein (Ntn-hydrolase superfamily)